MGRITIAAFQPKQGRESELLRVLADRLPLARRRQLFWPVHRKIGGRLRLMASGGAALAPENTLGAFRQYCSLASNTSSTPGMNDTNLYGPAPIGCFLNPSSPTCSTYFFGTTHPAPVAGVP